VRRLEPREAIQVARCVYRAYGYSHPNEDLYYPERIVHLNEIGTLISAVAVDAAGEVVGHYALERHPDGPVAESAQAIVSPPHRGRRLMERMRAFLEDEGRRLGLRGIYGQPVTTHVFSQRVNESFGSRVCAVSLGLAPRSVSFKGIQTEPLPQRESLLLYFKYLVPAPTAVAYAPAHHRAMLERLYAHLDAPVELRADPGDTPFDVRAYADGVNGERIDVSFKPDYGLGTIRVLQIGPDSGVAVRRVRRELAESGAEAIFVEIPLAQPGAPALCRAAESAGFYFSGIGPGFAADGDTLRLQYLSVPLETACLQVASPFARELLTYVEAERERVRRLA